MLPVDGADRVTKVGEPALGARDAKPLDPVRCISAPTPIFQECSRVEIFSSCVSTRTSMENRPSRSVIALAVPRATDMNLIGIVRKGLAERAPGARSRDRRCLFDPWLLVGYVAATGRKGRAARHGTTYSVNESK